jgi:CBS domain-containing protein
MYTTGMVRIRGTATLGEAARLMERHRIGVLLVTDADDTAVGVLTERDLVRSVAESRHPDQGTAVSYMAPVVVDAHGAVRLPDTDAAGRVGIVAHDLR